eukprot:972835-Rhodomonas_salina.1
MQPEDLEVVLLWEPEIGGDRLVVEVRGFPTNNVTLEEVYDKIEDLEDDPLGNTTLPFDVELDAGPTVYFGVLVSSIELSRFRTETFNETRQEQLIGGLSRLLGLEASELQVSGLENSGEAEWPLVVQVVLAPDAGNLTALQDQLRTAISSGALGSELQTSGMEGVTTSLMAVALGTAKLPEPIAGGGLPDDVPHVSVELTIAGETVESFDAEKHGLLKEALGGLLGLVPSDLQVVLIAEPTIDGTE